MRVAIVTRPSFRSPRYLATGLQRMLRRAGVQADCYVNGIPWLEAIRLRRASRRHRAVAAFADLWLRWLRRYDLLVVSDTIGATREAEMLAPLRHLGKPLFFYEVFALTGSKYWLDRLPASAVSQFDAFLVSSAIHDDPPVEGPPIFEIGLELLESPTTRRSKPFLAMIDFERKGYEHERRVQSESLDDARIASFSLSGEYSFDAIAREYDRAAIAFLAFPEAFGVPIAQLQHAGAVIASPRRGWAKRHALLPAGSVFSEAAPFSENFVFYGDRADLAEKLRALAREHDPQRVARRLRERQPHLVSGNAVELARALEYARESGAGGR